MTAITNSAPARERVASNEMVATTLFIFTEVMLFVGLIAGYIVTRSNYEFWPPLGQEPMPVALTALNTFFLLLSAVTIKLCTNAIVSDKSKLAFKWMLATLFLGLLFLGLQGVEWVNLLVYGDKSNASDMYASFFYTLIGVHAIHVVGATLSLIWAAIHLSSGAYTSSSWEGLKAIRLFWWFVVLVWPILYIMVYLW